MDSVKLKELQTELWNIVNKYVGPEDRGAVLGISGMMISIAIELYTVVLQDEDIEGVLEVVSEEIPLLRAKMESELGERTLH